MTFISDTNCSFNELESPRSLCYEMKPESRHLKPWGQLHIHWPKTLDCVLEMLGVLTLMTSLLLAPNKCCCDGSDRMVKHMSRVIKVQMHLT